MPGACELRLLDRTPSQAAQCVAEWAASVLASVGRVVGSPASATLGDFLTSFVLAFCGLIAVVWLFAWIGENSPGARPGADVCRAAPSVTAPRPSTLKIAVFFSLLPLLIGSALVTSGWDAANWLVFLIGVLTMVGAVALVYFAALGNRAR